MRGLFAAVVFLGTGVLSTVLSQFLVYSGAAQTVSALLPFAQYFGMMLGGVVPCPCIMPGSDGDNTDSSTAKTRAKAKIQARGKGKGKGTKSRPRTRSGSTGRGDGGAGSDGPVGAAGSAATRRGASVLDGDAAGGPGQVVAPDPAPVVDAGSMGTAGKRGVPPALGGADTATADGEVPSLLSLAMGAVFGGAIRSGRVGHRSDMAAYARGLSVNKFVYLSVGLEMWGFVSGLVGLALAGSGIYQVVYASVVIWAALLSRTLIGTPLARGQVIGICTVSVGLAFSALGELESEGGEEAFWTLAGVAMTLVSACTFGMSYVLAEATMKFSRLTLTPRVVCVRIGATASALFAAYILVSTLPNWDERVAEPIEAHGGVMESIVFAYVAFCASALLHSVAYFALVGTLGAVMTGLLQSLRAVAVFLLSAALFCSRQHSQCYTAERAFSTLVVVSGVLMYSYGKASAGGKPLPVAEQIEAALDAGGAAGKKTMGGGGGGVSAGGGSDGGGVSDATGAAANGLVEGEVEHHGLHHDDTDGEDDGDESDGVDAQFSTSVLMHGTSSSTAGAAAVLESAPLIAGAAAAGNDRRPRRLPARKPVGSDSYFLGGGGGRSTGTWV